MRNLWLSFWIIVFCANTFAQNTLLWRFYKKDYPVSYVYGTMHSARIKKVDYHDSLDKIIHKSKHVFVELDSKQMEAASAEIMLKMILPSGTTMKTLLTSDEYSRYQKYVSKKLNSSAAMLDYVHPMMITIMLTMHDEQLAVKDSSDVTVDQYIENQALVNKIEVSGIETPTEQVDALLSISYKESVKYLMEMVDSTNSDGYSTDMLVSFYKEQKLDEIYKMSEDPKYKEGMSELQVPLIDARNKRITDRTIDHIKSTKQQVLLAVGTMHLVGKNGVLNLLKTKGFIVEPVWEK